MNFKQIKELASFIKTNKNDLKWVKLALNFLITLNKQTKGNSFVKHAV